MAARPRVGKQRGGVNHIAAKMRIMERREVASGGRGDLGGQIIQASGCLHDLLDRSVGSHAHSLGAALRRPECQRLLGPVLVKRVDRLQKAAAILRHTTTFSVEMLVDEVRRALLGEGMAPENGSGSAEESVVESRGEPGEVLNMEHENGTSEEFDDGCKASHAFILEGIAHIMGLEELWVPVPPFPAWGTKDISGGSMSTAEGATVLEQAHVAFEEKEDAAENMESNDEPVVKDTVEQQDLGDYKVAKPVAAAVHSMLMQLQEATAMQVVLDQAKEAFEEKGDAAENMESGDEPAVKDTMEQQNLGEYKVGLPVAAAGHSMLVQLQEATGMQVGVSEESDDEPTVEDYKDYMESDDEPAVKDNLEQQDLGEYKVAKPVAAAGHSMLVQVQEATVKQVVVKEEAIAGSGEAKVVRRGLRAVDAWPPSADWPKWWTHMPREGCDIVLEMCALQTPFAATVLAIELIGFEKFDSARLALGLAAGASLFDRLHETLAKDRARYGG
eukprot:CAMPEP_0204109126 /NCGR_PEP_ID=MMETSP0361-20130328/1111_1 /ASSEMBLY_ACC=CAM_ASM_000343 /TAXON_ID=268821 /ORGANISM="Scrippsiella Hangoei, Strain SHTV-5" /LENGTH=501 /DNA_ID=CAMNT_0051058843 /DNA_START=62 /DNA_END=1567 /DNA_ORIENTATION=-